jgi:hypothetical protein
MLYLIEKYAPEEMDDSIGKYDPQLDVAVTGAYVPYIVQQLK